MSDESKFEQIVSEALEKEPAFELPYDFADRVVLKIQQQAVATESKRDKWWLISGIISVIGAFVFAFTQVTFTPSVGVFTFFQGYSGLVIFGLVFVTALHLVDKLVLSKKARIGLR